MAEEEAGLQLDMENRDPNGINGHIQVAFEDVLAEVEGAHSIDCVWRNTYKCYEGGRGCCYKFLTTLCGICIGLYWGCLFACVAFEHIWCLTPTLKCQTIDLTAWRNCYKAWIDCILGPLCELCGLCNGKWHLTKA